MTNDGSLYQSFQFANKSLHGASTLITLHIEWNRKIVWWLALFYLDIPEIYFDNFFDVAYEIEKNIYSGHVPLCVSQMGPRAKIDWKALN